MRTVKLNGKRLRELRVARGLTVLALSGKAELSEGTIKTAESDGEKDVYPGTLAALASALQVSNEELMVDGQPPVKMVRVIFEMPVPFEEFQQQIHGERLLEILAKLLMIKPTIKGIERGSTRVIVEMTEDEAEMLIEYMRSRESSTGGGYLETTGSLIDSMKKLKDLAKPPFVTKVTFDSVTIDNPRLPSED